jgi:hypothetical protein
MLGLTIRGRPVRRRPVANGMIVSAQGIFLLERKASFGRTNKRWACFIEIFSRCVAPYRELDVERLSRRNLAKADRALDVC